MRSLPSVVCYIMERSGQTSPPFHEGHSGHPRGNEPLLILDRFRTALHALQNDPANPDRIHHLRVAIRRLRAALSRSDSNQRQVWKVALRPLFQALGNLRDLQVQRDVLSRLHPLSLPDFDPFAQPAMEAALTELQAALQAFAFPAINEEGPVSAKEARSMPALRRSSQKKEHKMIRLVRKLRDDLADLHGDAQHLHAMRIRLKRLRYSLDIISPHPHSGEALHLLKIWQDRLGELQDLMVLRRTALQQHFLSPGLDRAIEARRAILLQSLEGEMARRLRRQLLKMPGVQGHPVR